MFFEKVEYLVNIYKSDSLRGKLSKMTIYIYIKEFVYFILKSTTSYTYLKINFWASI